MRFFFIESEKKSGGATLEHNSFPDPLCTLNAMGCAMEAPSFRADSRAKPVLLALRSSQDMLQGSSECGGVARFFWNRGFRVLWMILSYTITR